MLASQAFHNRPYADRFWGYLFFNAFSQQTNDHVVPGLVGEFGGLWVDENMATTIPGLFAAGDLWCTARGPGAPRRSRGAIAARASASRPSQGGWPARPPRSTPPARSALALSDEQIAAVDARFTAPLKSTGSMKPMEMVAEIQKLMQPLGNSLYRHETA